MGKMKTYRFPNSTEFRYKKKHAQFSKIFWILHEKIQYSKASIAIDLKDIRILKIPRIYRIHQKISC